MPIELIIEEGHVWTNEIHERKSYDNHQGQITVETIWLQHVGMPEYHVTHRKERQSAQSRIKISRYINTFKAQDDSAQPEQ